MLHLLSQGLGLGQGHCVARGAGKLMQQSAVQAASGLRSQSDLHHSLSTSAGGPAFSLPAVLARQPPHVPAVRFMNFEGQPEAGDLTNRIEQAS